MEGDIAAHLAHQFLRDHQPQPCAAVASGDAGIGLAEGLEQTGLIALRNTDAGIANLDLNLYLVIADGALFYQHVNVAVFGELDGVTDQIGNDLLQTQRVADDVVRHVIFNVQRQLKPFIVRRMRQQRDHFIQ